MTSLGPYIATLDASKQAEIKGRVGDRLLGRLRKGDEEGTELEGASTTALREIREMLNEVVKGGQKESNDAEL